MLARRDLAEATAAREMAEARAQDAAAALVEEGRQGGPAYAAWLPRGINQRDKATEAARQAEGRVTQAAAALAATRAAERAVERLAEVHAAEARREAQRAEQRMLDEAGARTACRGGVAAS
jgi:hypothetical protein